MYRILFFLMLLVGFIFLSAPVYSQVQRTVTVNGTSSIYLQPDMVTVHFGIVSKHIDPEQARAANAEASKQALNIVRELGVTDRKIRLEQLRLNPARTYNPNTRRYEESGFEVTRTLVVELDDLDALPTLIARVVQKGANRLDGVSYGLRDKESARTEALREATLNAKAKAQLLVETLDTELGAVLVIAEQGVVVPTPRPITMNTEAVAIKAMDATPEPEAYAAGEIEVTAHITVTFELR